MTAIIETAPRGKKVRLFDVLSSRRCPVCGLRKSRFHWLCARCQGTVADTDEIAALRAAYRAHAEAASTLIALAKQVMETGPAEKSPSGPTPFVNRDDRVWYDNRDGKDIEFGHYFESDRGYRAFFKFKDSPARNTWNGESLLSWANALPASTKALRELQSTCRVLARQVISLDAEWVRQGRPRDGIHVGPGGRA